VSWPAPTPKDHDEFCRAEQWTLVRNARGRTGTHHITYEYQLPDGRVLRTRVSHPVDRTGYGPSMWKHILWDQLQVSETEFWACVRDGIRPDRGVPAPPSHALPADLVHLLITKLGIDEWEVASMTRQDAIARLQEYWASER
jgi:hypothetical protein